MPYTVLEASTAADLAAQLNRTVFGRYLRHYKNTNNDDVIPGLSGTTLIFTSPVGTLTFSGVAGADILVSDLRSELAGFGPVNLSLEWSKEAKAWRVRVQLDAGWTLSDTGTANALLGFDTGAPTAVPAVIAAADIVATGDSAFSAHYWAIIAP